MLKKKYCLQIHQRWHHQRYCSEQQQQQEYDLDFFFVRQQSVSWSLGLSTTNLHAAKKPF